MDDSTQTPSPSGLPDPRDLIIAQQAATIARLEARIRELEKIIDELRRGGERQAAPFSKGSPKLNPKNARTKTRSGLWNPADEREAGERSLRSTKIHATKLTQAIRAMCKSKKTNKANERLAKFLYRHADQLFTFLRDAKVEATNWRGEQAIRGAVVNRKVWGGNRTWNGATTQAILMTVLNTLNQRGKNGVEWIRKHLLHQNPPLLQ